MRGYVTRVGFGLLLSAVLMMSLSLGLAASLQPRSQRTQAHLQTVGPFLARVERVVQRSEPDGPARVYVQVHLWRANGPVPLAKRVPVRGTARLAGSWLPAGDRWLIRNEFSHGPAVDAYELPGLGRVPATHHAGEVRAVFEFQGHGPLGALEFRLPTGESVTFDQLVVERN